MYNTKIHSIDEIHNHLFGQVSVEQKLQMKLRKQERDESL